MKEALIQQGDAFAGHPDLFTFSTIANSTSMTFSEKYGDAWILHKKVCKNALRTFSQTEAQDSSASCILEESICAETVEMVEALKTQQQEGEGWTLRSHLSPLWPMWCVPCALGKGTTRATRSSSPDLCCRDLADFFPVFCYLPSPSLRKMVQDINRMNSFMEANIEEHLMTFDKNCVRDITDAPIALCEDRDEDWIVHTVIDIFGAGDSSTSDRPDHPLNSKTMSTGVPPHIHGSPVRKKMPQVNFSPKFLNPDVFPGENPDTTENIILNGYFTPKDTSVFINQCHVNNDSDIWGDPDKFRPERFLSESRHFNKALTEKVMIFGMVKRHCLGDTFARLEILMFLTTLLYCLHIENVPGQVLELSADFGLTMKPKTFRTRVSPRRCTVCCIESFNIKNIKMSIHLQNTSCSGADSKKLKKYEIIYLK
uniref:unspecific monooxygenase n=1 Tax=Denticeps clupeoides TaxID=299321 RepID=A0AAY4CXQ4_9TELE